MEVMNVIPDQCKYDLISLGEVMLRLGIGDGHILGLR